MTSSGRRSSVTAPAPGALLRGTVDVAADVSDNVGVAAVDFRYHGGTLPFVDIATDTTPPYEATFDSTQVREHDPRRTARSTPSRATRPETKPASAMR